MVVLSFDSPDPNSRSASPVFQMEQRIVLWCNTNSVQKGYAWVNSVCGECSNSFQKYFEIWTQKVLFLDHLDGPSQTGMS